VTDRSAPYEQIKNAILDATLAPGTALVESSLAELFAVSRTPIREALLRLEQDGMVERTDRGLIVRDRSPEQVLDIYETRIILETAAARFAATKHSTIDRIRLSKLLEETSDFDVSDPSELARLNRSFHRGVWQASHNEALVDLLNRLSLHLMRYPATTLAYPGRWERALEQHRELVDAILARDADEAARVAEVHFTEARDIRLKLWETDTF
jgi:DNA-binding GntR family transcriptional regulator